MISQWKKELSELKSVIRGLIISSVGEMTIRRLEREYEKSEGVRFPYLSFGYPSAESFLLSLPDVVYVREAGAGCPSYMAVVETVQCDRSRHIEQMVSRQNNAKTLNAMKRYSGFPGSQARKRFEKNSSKGIIPRFIHFTLRTSLARVCQRYAPHGLPLESLGKELSHDLSMTGWEEEGRCGWIKANGFGSLEEVIEGFWDNGLIKITTRNGKEWVTSCMGERDWQKTSGELERRGRNQRSGDCVLGSDGSNVFPLLHPSDEEVLSSLVTDKMKANFQKILAKHPDGLRCADLPKEYEAISYDEFDVRRMGFLSVVEMAAKLKDVFTILRPGTYSDWLLFDCKSYNIQNSTTAPIKKKEGKYNSPLPSTVTENVTRLLFDHPDGVEWTKFLEAYESKHKEDFPWLDLGFINLKAALSHLEHYSIVQLKNSNSGPVVCLPGTNACEDDDFFQELYPDGVVGCNEEIPLQELPEDLAPGSHLNVIVTEVQSPSSFWFQIWENRLQKDFEAMMIGMQEFYGGNGPSLHRIPYFLLMIGQYCAAKYPCSSSPNAVWHRAMITSIPSMTEVEVYYVDYGTRVKAQKLEIFYFLDKRFSDLPCLAHMGCLTCIRPVGYNLWKKSRHKPDSMYKKPTWSKSSSSYVQDLVYDVPVVATVTHIRKLDNYLSMSLTDTNGMMDNHIGDMLVSAGLAEFGISRDDEDLYTCLNPFKQAKKHSAIHEEFEKETPREPYFLHNLMSKCRI